MPLEREAAAMPRLNLGLKEGSTKAEINDMSCELHCMPPFLVHSCSCLRSVEMRTPRGQPECRSRRTWLGIKPKYFATNCESIHSKMRILTDKPLKHLHKSTPGWALLLPQMLVIFLCESSCLHFSSGELVRTRDVLPVTEG